MKILFLRRLFFKADLVKKEKDKEVGKRSGKILLLEKSRVYFQEFEMFNCYIFTGCQVASHC